MTLTRRQFFFSLAASALAAGVLPVGFPREAVAPKQGDMIVAYRVSYDPWRVESITAFELYGARLAS